MKRFRRLGGAFAVVAATALTGCPLQEVLVGDANTAPTSLLVSNGTVYFSNMPVSVNNPSGGQSMGWSIAELQPHSSGYYNAAWKAELVEELDSLVINGNNLYWLSVSQDGNGTILSGPAVGGIWAPLFPAITAQPNLAGVHALAASSNGIYWANTGGARLLFVPLTGGAPVSVLPALAPTGTNYYPYSVCVDATNVYFTNDAGDLFQLPQSGSFPITPKQIGSGDHVNAHTNVAVDATSVYWADYDTGNVKKVAIGGGDVVTLATGQQKVTGLTTDSGNVYWTIFASSGSVMRVPADGSSAPVAIATNQTYPLDVVVDSTYVYWTSSDLGFPPHPSTNGVLRMSK